jgi:hypothetical protein
MTDHLSQSGARAMTGAERLWPGGPIRMTPEQAAVADRDWRALRAERDRADAACRAAAIAHHRIAEVKRIRDELIAEAVRAGEAAQVARLCGLSRQQVYAIAAETPSRGRTAP